VWDFVAGLDLSPLHARIRAVEGHAGRPPIDPAILLALWLHATLEGVGSARALARLCGEHDAYRWLCGGVGVNHHTPADFRVDHGDVLDGLLTGSVAALMADGLVTMERVAQDGVRVRASAGAASFRRRDALEEALDAAEAQVSALRAELDDPEGTSAISNEPLWWPPAKIVGRHLAPFLASHVGAWTQPDASGVPVDVARRVDLKGDKHGDAHREEQRGRPQDHRWKGCPPPAQRQLRNPSTRPSPDNRESINGAYVSALPFRRKASPWLWA